MSFALVSGAAARCALRLRLLALGALAASSAACSTLPAATSSVVGCFEDDIEISHAQKGPSGDTWTATCHGNVYDCAREEHDVETSGWALATSFIPPSPTRLEHQRFRGTMTGATYCLLRDKN